MSSSGSFATSRFPPGHLPAGFRVVWLLAGDRVLTADLVRDISQDADGLPRPTPVLFSADTANPYELEPIAPLIANLTCNPGIIYDLFINNPDANVDHRVLHPTGGDDRDRAHPRPRL